MNKDTGSKNTGSGNTGSKEAGVTVDRINAILYRRFNGGDWEPWRALPRQQAEKLARRNYKDFEVQLRIFVP